MRRSVRGTPRRGRATHRLGTLYAVATAILLALQPPFSASAARNLSSRAIASALNRRGFKTSRGGECRPSRCATLWRARYLTGRQRRKGRVEVTCGTSASLSRAVCAGCVSEIFMAEAPGWIHRPGHG
jgi:hypothetical protein